MLTVSENRQRVLEALRVAARRAITLVRSNENLAVPVPGSDWTVGDTAAHLVVVFRVYAEAARSNPGAWIAQYVNGPEATPERVAAGNAAAIQAVSSRDPNELADMLGEAVQAFLEVLADRPGHVSVPTPWYGSGQTRKLQTLAGLGLGELVIHGYDMARALGRRWRIDADHARQVIAAACSMIPHYVNTETAKGLNASYGVHVRGGDSFLVRFSGGIAEVNAMSGRADCHLSVDPVAFLLVAYGRMSQWGPITKGKLMAWGRKPWLGFRFKSLVRNP